MRTTLFALGIVALSAGAAAYRLLSPSQEGAERIRQASTNPVISVAPMAQATGARRPDEAFWRKQKEFRRLATLADEARGRGEVDAAAELYGQAIRVQDDPLVRLDRATMYDEAGWGVQALEAYDGLFESRSMGGSYATNPGVVARYARLLEKAGRTQEAVGLYRAMFAKYVPREGGELPPVRTNANDLSSLRAVAKMLEGYEHDGHMEPRRALACYEEATRIKPDYGLGYLYVAYVANSLDDANVEDEYDKAVKHGDAETRAAAAKLRSLLIDTPRVYRRQQAARAAGR